MGLVGFLDACRAIVEVWAVHALVSSAPDVLVVSACTFEDYLQESYLIAPIADRTMTHVATRRAELGS